MKRAHWGILALGGGLALVSAQLRSEGSTTDQLDTAFVDGGRITIALSAGEHRISESADDHIRVRWSVDREYSSQDVDARTNIDGSTAKIEIDGPRKNFRTFIEVPRHSDLVVRLTAGELFVGDIEGDKDIRLRAGDLSIDVGDGKAYAHVEGSLWAGDIDGGPLDRDASGLFRSIDWRGEGEHELRFHLYAGDVTLH